MLRGAVARFRGTRIAQPAVVWHDGSATVRPWGCRPRHRLGVGGGELRRVLLQNPTRQSNRVFRRLRGDPEFRRDSPQPVDRLGNPNASPPPADFVPSVRTRRSRRLGHWACHEHLGLYRSRRSRVPAATLPVCPPAPPPFCRPIPSAPLGPAPPRAPALLAP